MNFNNRKVSIRFLSTLMLISILGVSYGQDDINLPPQARKLKQYGDYPVSHYTGLPQIEIPIYNIKVGDIEFPITLSYHASGIKLNDPSGYVGLGWTLHCGGQITHQVNSDAEMSFVTESQLPKTVSELAYNYEYKTHYLHGIENDNNERDIYNYSFNSKSGQFIFCTKDSIATTIPYNNLKISLNKGRTYSVTTDNGIKYDFKEKMTNYCYMLSTITSLNTKDSIVFTYTKDSPYQYFELVKDKYTIDDLYDVNFKYESATYDLTNRVGYGGGGDDTYYYVDIKPDYQIISKIEFRGGSIEFELNDDDMLEEIRIYNSDEELIKSVDFTIEEFPGYFTENDLKRYKLSGIEFLDSEGEAIEEYSFTYYNEGKEMPDVMDRGIDFWGYYNGEANETLLPAWELTYYELADNYNTYTTTIGDADRESHIDYMKYYTLKQITYPSGGYTVFDFDANKYYNEDNDEIEDVGGLRIESIKNYDSDGELATQKTYAYGEDQCGYGIMEVKPTIDNYITVQKGIYVVGTLGSSTEAPFRRRIISCDPTISLTPNGSSVIYTNVREYDGTEDDNNGYTDFEYDYVANEYASVRCGSETDYGWGEYLDSKPRVTVNQKQFRQNINDWNSGQLLSKVVRNKNGGTVYKLINTYDTTQTFIRQGLKLERYVFIVYSNLESTSFTDYEQEVYEYDLTYYLDLDKDSDVDIEIIDGQFNFNDSYIDVGYKNLVKSKVTQNGVTTTTKYTYDDYNQLETKKEYDSKGGYYYTLNYYPYSDFSGAVYNTMIARNMLKNICKTSTSYIGADNNTTSLSVNETYYKKWGDNKIIAPRLTYNYNQVDDDTVSCIHYDAYDDYGNLLEYHKSNSIHTSYLYGYNHQYTIAKIVNAEYEDITNADAITALTDEDKLLSAFEGLRNSDNLSDAQVTGYTYIPLIGLSSKTDPAGHTTYYKYDDFGRLEYIKDQEGRVIKKYTYHYANE